MTGKGSAEEMQTTIQREAHIAGIGLFTGEQVSLRILPAPPNTGIVFRRLDLPATPEIKAHLSFVRETPRCTRLANGSASIHMVEHLLAALSGMGIDNAYVLVTGPEIVAGDGSAKLFVDLLDQAGEEKQTVARRVYRISRPIYWSEGDVHLVALPAPEFRLSYTLHYPQSPWLGSQFYTFSVNRKDFKEDIAPCRTFSLYEEILPLIEKGMIKGGGLDNALVIRGNSIMNPEGARFPDEPVRHKILDLIGDLKLLGAIEGHIIAVRSGHSSNIAFAKHLAKLEGQ